MDSAKVEKIVVYTGQKKIELTLEEVKELKKVFSDLFGEVIYIPYNPYYYPYRYTYTYGDGGTVISNINGELMHERF